MPKRAHPEWSLQTKIKGFVREWVACPHEFAAHDRSANIRGMQHLWEKERGIRAGWPDTELLLPGGVTFRCELKWGDNKVVPGDDQDVLIARLNDLGHPAAWANTVTKYLEEARKAWVPFREGADIRARQLDQLLQAAAPAKKPRAGSKPRKPRADTARIARMEKIRAKTMF
jgi:hypothetical protein